MQSYVARRVVNGLIWAISGVLVIMIRVLLARGPSLIIWEILGAAMIVYGVSRIALTIVKGEPTRMDDSLAPVAV